MPNKTKKMRDFERFEQRERGEKLIVSTTWTGSLKDLNIMSDHLWPFQTMTHSPDHVDHIGPCWTLIDHLGRLDHKLKPLTMFPFTSPCQAIHDHLRLLLCDWDEDEFCKFKVKKVGKLRSIKRFWSEQYTVMYIPPRVSKVFFVFCRFMVSAVATA